MAVDLFSDISTNKKVTKKVKKRNPRKKRIKSMSDAESANADVVVIEKPKKSVFDEKGFFGDDDYDWDFTPNFYFYHGIPNPLDTSDTNIANEKNKKKFTAEEAIKWK